MRIFKFGDCYLNLTERRVLKDGQFVELTTKTFDLLQLLVERRGEIVTKDEILGSVWNGSFVEEGNLAVHISKLRRLLDANKTAHFIETVQGCGYRFIPTVKAIADEEWRKHLPAENFLRYEKPSGEFILDSIAVLPLDNESSDAEIEYLADGLTEGFINNLSHLPDLKVIARNTVFRYKNKEVDSKEFGETLGVTAVLTGRVRVIKERLLISVELTKTEDGRQLWGTQINQPLSDIVEVQESIISAVTEKLKSQIETKNSVVNSITQNSESYRLYLKGKYFFGKRTEKNIYKAIECFQKSVSFDPTNVYSYAEMVECHRLLCCLDYASYSEFSVKVQPLLCVISKLNESVDIVQAMYGAKMILDWQFERAEKHLQQALHLNSNCLLAHYRYVDCLLISGRHSEALKELNLIMQVDPLSLISYLVIARAFYRMERYETALMYLKDALELEPNNFETLAVMGVTLIGLGDFATALDILHKALNIEKNIEMLATLGCVHALKGEKGKAFEIIRQIQSQPKPIRNYPLSLSKIYLTLGEKERAYEFLEQAFENHDIDLNALQSDPRWATIRGEMKFKNLVKKVGIPI